jgi:hypothetical protein
VRMGARRIAMAAALALLGVIGPADAQTPLSAELKACLCQEQSVSALNSEVQAQSRIYEEKRQGLEALDQQVQTSRGKVNVRNQAEIDAFKQLLQRRDEAADALAGPVTARYAEVVRRYNEAVADYNSVCAGKVPEADAETKRTLSCAKP